MTREDLKEDVKRLLYNDSHAVYECRTKLRKSPGWDQLDKQEREQKMRDSALDVLQCRKDRGQHISYHYPVLASYVPTVVDGRRTTVNAEAERVTSRILQEGGRVGTRTQGEEDDDEEMPLSLKKQEGEQPQELSNIPAYVPKCKARPTGNEKATQQHRSSNANFEKMPKSHEARAPPRRTTRKIAAAKKDSYDEDESEAELESDLGYDSDDGSDSEDAKDAKEQCKKRKAVFPMVAVRRGLALLKDTPTKATPEVKHRFSTIVEGARKAVLRGRVNNKDDEAINGEWTWVEKKGWTLVKKQACEDESESDVGDCIQVVSKKAKVEAAS
jgi:hypothetical protein